MLPALGTPVISVYITCKDSNEAGLIAARLLERKLIACANILPITSMFNWQGRITKEKEVAMLCKTRKELFIQLREEVRQLHSYHIPCIVALPWADSDPDYRKWVEEETGA